MPTAKNEGFITWANFLVVLGIVMTAMITINTFVWTQHAREMVQFEKRMDSQFLNLKERLERIDKHLEKR